MSNLPNPYVGPRAYEAHETLYGRDREIRQLVALLIAERIVLLHSPSGAGKTSLLQAGLIPRMRAEDFQVLPVVRVNLEIPTELASKAANRYLLSTLLSLEEDVPETHRLNLADLPGLSLDAYLAGRYHPQDSSSSELMVFDQFEEVLTVFPSDREGKLAFFEQLGAALRNRNRWAIFAMREDYVAALAPYLRPIPNRLAAAFRLDLLGRDAARQAIQKPAQEGGVDFTTPAAEKLVDDLSQVQEQAPDGSIEFRSGLYVEPVQLQVVCYRLWDTQVTDDRTITVADLGQVGSVDDSLAAYYAESVARVAQSTGIEERAIREWFGSQLITPEDVRSQVLLRASSSDGLDNRAIFQLVDAHILRAEKRAGSTWFELAHDRLIVPVRKSNAVWFKANLRLFQIQAGLWEQHGHESDMLLRGKAYLDAMKEASSIVLTPVEKDFMKACDGAWEQEKRDRKRSRIMTILAIAASIAMVTSVILGFSIIMSERRYAESLQGAISTAEAGQAAAVKAQAASEIDREVALSARATSEIARSAALNAKAIAEMEAKINLSKQLISLTQSFPEGLGEKYEPKGLLAVEAARLSLQLGQQQKLDNFLALDSFLKISGRMIINMKAGNSTVAYSPNGQWVASEGTGSTVLVWEAATGKIIASMQHGGAGLTSIAFSSDGKWVVSGGNDKAARVWVAATGELVATMMHDGQVSYAGFIPNDQRVVTVSHGDDQNNNTLWVWETASGNLQAKMYQDNINSISFSPDSSLLVTGGNDDMVRVWEVKTGKQLVEMKHDGDVSSVAFNPVDGRFVVSGSWDSTARVWDVETGAEKFRIVHDNTVRTVAFSPDGSWIVTSSDDRTARIWNAFTGEKRGNAMWHDRGVLSAEFSSDGKWVVTTCWDNTVRVWDTYYGIEIARMQHDDFITAAVFNPVMDSDRVWLISGSWDGTARVWEATNASEELKRQQWAFANSSVAFSPDGRLVAVSRSEGIQVWDFATSQEVLWLERENTQSIAFSQDSLRLVAGYADGGIEVWRVDTGDQLLRMKQEGSVTTVAFSPDGKRLASMSQSRMVQVWDAGTGNRLWERPDDMVTSLAFSPDGARLVSGDYNGIIQILDANNGQQLGTMQNDLWINAIAFSPDGQSVLAGGFDASVPKWSVSQWNARTGEQVTHIEHNENISVMAFSPDGQWVAVGRYNNAAAWVWHIPSDQLAAQMDYGEYLFHVAFSPDSRKVASVVFDKPLQIQSFQPEDMIQEACARLTRNLTIGEWQAYIGDFLPFEPSCPNLPAGGE